MKLIKIKNQIINLDNIIAIRKRDDAKNVFLLEFISSSNLFVIKYESEMSRNMVYEDIFLMGNVRRNF